jgi:hypothetical protein
VNYYWEENDKLINMKKALEAPRSLSAALSGIDGEINLQWDSVTNANGYIVEYSRESETLRWEQADFVPAPQCTITGLKKNESYCFRVSAMNSSRQGEWSGIAKKRIPDFKI